jgi:hypothetical protein
MGGVSLDDEHRAGWEKLWRGIAADPSAPLPNGPPAAFDPKVWALH